ncbi:hypothetical protein LCGC14_2811770, partial [marine sediment metagenome]
MEKYLWLEGDEGDITHVTTYNTYEELFEAVQAYLVGLYWLGGVYWGANECVVFNFIKVTDKGTE